MGYLNIVLSIRYGAFLKDVSYPRRMFIPIYLEHSYKTMLVLGEYSFQILEHSYKIMLILGEYILWLYIEIFDLFMPLGDEGFLM